MVLGTVGWGSSLPYYIGDIEDSFSSFRDIAKKLSASSSDCWNDMDMLTCGMYAKGNVAMEAGCTDTEDTTEFALWCLMGVPLMLGYDLWSMK